MWKAIHAGFLKPGLGGRVIFEPNSPRLEKYYTELQSVDVLKFIFNGNPLPRKYGNQEISLYTKVKIKLWYEYDKGRLTLSVPICCFDADINPDLPIWPLRSKQCNAQYSTSSDTLPSVFIFLMAIVSHIHRCHHENQLIRNPQRSTSPNSVCFLNHHPTYSSLLC